METFGQELGEPFISLEVQETVKEEKGKVRRSP